MLFSELKSEVKRRATRNQSGGEFNTAIENAINSSLFRVGREALWRSMRKNSSFETKRKYITGSGAAAITSGTKSLTVTGATFLTDGIQVGRRIKIEGDSIFHRISTITGETTLTLERNYNASSNLTSGTYSILGQEEYNLPIQSGHKLFLWHEEYGYPYMLTYIPDQEFYASSFINTSEAVPVAYRMWGEDMVIEQVRSSSVISISSSDSADTNISLTVFGVVSGYPDFEVITTDGSDGTTASAGSKSFDSVERIVASSSRVGRITATANSGNTTVSVLPVGSSTTGIVYRKAQIYLFPTQYSL